MTITTAEELARFQSGITWLVVHSKTLTAQTVESYLPNAEVFQMYEPYPVFFAALPAGSNFSDPYYTIGKLQSGLHNASSHGTFADAQEAAVTVCQEFYLT